MQIQFAILMQKYEIYECATKHRGLRVVIVGHMRGKFELMEIKHGWEWGGGVILQEYSVYF